MGVKYRYVRERQTFDAMRRRCFNPNSIDYKNYGGRGIGICERWLEPKGQGYKNFLADMGKRPEGKYTIDRIDNNADYSPENCHWVDRNYQGNNKRTNFNITRNGITKTFTQWARESKVKVSTAQQRYYVYGWSVERSLGWE